MRNSIFLIHIVIGVISCASYQGIRYRPCKNSRECSSVAPCCRDEKGNTIVDLKGRRTPLLSTDGTCSNLLGAKGDMCDSSCGCQTGYTCYRPMSGFCCPPMKCYNTTWVDDQREYWANCRPPKCHFPR